MYGVPWEDLIKAFCKPKVKVGKEWVNKGQNAQQVRYAVDIEVVFERCFSLRAQQQIPTVELIFECISSCSNVRIKAVLFNCMKKL